MLRRHTNKNKQSSPNKYKTMFIVNPHNVPKQTVEKSPITIYNSGDLSFMMASLHSPLEHN